MDVSPSACPACGALVGEAHVCSVCGLDLEGPSAAVMRDLIRELSSLDREMTELDLRRAGLAEELHDRRVASGLPAPPATRSAWSLPAPPPPPPASWSLPNRRAPRPPVEWTTDRVRNVLLWLGAALLALAALTFTVVAWTHLSDGGRGALLLGATAVATIVALALRDRLPATAEAIAALAIGLALIDWQALWRAGAAGGMSASAWWAIGAIVVSAFGWALGRVAARRLAGPLVAVLLPVAAVLIVVTVAGAPWSGALGLALIAAAITGARVVIRQRVSSDAPDALLRVEAAIAWIAAAILGAFAATFNDGFATALVPAVAVLSLGLAPGIAVRWRQVLDRAPDRRAADAGMSVPALLAALAAGAPIGAAVTIAGGIVGAHGVLLATALFAIVTLVVAGSLTQPWRGGSATAATIAFVPGFAWAVAGAAAATFAPLAWLAHGWTGDAHVAARDVFAGPLTDTQFVYGWVAVAIVASGVAFLLVAHWVARRSDVDWSRHTIASAVGAGFALAAVLAPVAAGATIAVAFTTTLVLASLALVATTAWSRVRSAEAWVPLPAATVAVIPLAGWAAVARPLTLVALSILLGVTIAAVAAARGEPLRSALLAVAGALAVGLTGAAVGANTSALGVTGFAMAMAGGALLLGGALVRSASPDSRVSEITGGLGIAAGLLVAGGASNRWLAVTFTVLVAVFAVASLRRDRTLVYGSIGGATALFAVWTWLVVESVHVVEAYTLPAAALALVLGALVWRGGAGRSWVTLGPALVLALGPTLALAVRHDDTTRAVIVGVAAFGVVIGGALRRLQAPLAIGGAALLVLAIDTLGPAAARLPRWVVLAVAGALLLWVGATFERRRDDVRSLSETIGQFG